MFENLLSRLNKRKYVWYCCYGSNLTRDRFMAYINGGTKTIKGKTLTEKGCSNKSSPIKEKGVTIPYELYFSGRSFKWDSMGVAFINNKKDTNVKTYAKMYLITIEQFLEVTSQENGSLSIFKINKAMKEALSTGEADIDKTSMYGKMLYIGKDEGYPILTFTSLNPMKSISKPCGKYIKMISEGLKETHGLSNRKMLKYFKGVQGSNEYNRSDLRSAISKGEIKSEIKHKWDYGTSYGSKYDYYKNGYDKYYDYPDNYYNVDDYYSQLDKEIDEYELNYIEESYKEGRISEQEYNSYLDEIYDRMYGDSYLGGNY